MEKKKQSFKEIIKQWNKEFTGTNPKEDFDAKKNHSIRNISVGAVIVTIALVVCIYQVSILRGVYAGRLSNEFQAHHETAALSLDMMVGYQMDLLEVAASSIGEHADTITAEEICDIIRNYEKLDGLHSVCYITDQGSVYDGKKGYTKAQLGTAIDTFLSVTDSENSKIFMTKKEFESTLWEAGERRIMLSAPVKKGNKTYGYVVGTVSLSNLLARDTFDYQNNVGECYLVDAEGYIAARSVDASTVKEDEDDIEIGLLSYSDSSEDSKKAIQMLHNALKDFGTGYESMRTSNGDSMQISYCPVNSMEGVMFISLYNDNMVDDMVQPLIVRNVISCTFIIVLMIAIVVFVWASSKRSSALIEKLAFEDPITKGRNVNYFKEFANMVLNTYRESSFMIYRFDISNFRYINEAYGHYRADKILKTVIQSFDNCFTERELCVRMNADQYLAIVINDGSLQSRMNQFQDEVNNQVKADGIKYPIRFKFGECQFSKHDRDIDVVIDHANVARKTLGKEDSNQSAKYSGKVIDEMNRVENIEQRQESALAHKEFRVYLQPKWNIEKDEIAGAEALVRWIRSDGRIMRPEEFVPIFEKNGFIERLDFYMLEEVCRSMREAVDSGRLVYPISVNQSRLLLHAPDYVENVLKILKKYDIPEGSIQLEITETVFQEDKKRMIEVMKRLREHGVKLAMDDFGSGYSSLNMLKDVPFDILKIDKDFFSETVTGEKSRWILQKIIDMAEGLEMEVVCEGVETKEQVEILKYIRCKMVQGYYYAKPLPAEDYYEKYAPVNRYV